MKRWACRSTLGMQACVSGQKTRSFRRLTAAPCSSIFVRGWPSSSPRALSCISAALCARIAARLAYFFGADRERKTCRCRHEVEMYPAPTNSSRPSRASWGFLCLLPPWPAFRPRDCSLQALYSPRALYTSPRTSFQRRRLYVLHAASDEPRASFAQRCFGTTGARNRHLGDPSKCALH